MRLDLDALPDDPALLQRLVRELVTDMERDNGEIEKLRRSASRTSMPTSAEPKCVTSSRPPRRPRRACERSGPRRQLPEELSRQDVVPFCGGTPHVIGETVSEMLD